MRLLVNMDVSNLRKKNKTQSIYIYGISFKIDWKETEYTNEKTCHNCADNIIFASVVFSCFFWLKKNKYQKYEEFCNQFVFSILTIPKVEIRILIFKTHKKENKF